MRPDSMRRGSGEQPHDRERSDRFAGAALADDAERVADGNAEGDAVDRPDDAVFGVKVGAEVVDFDSRIGTTKDMESYIAARRHKRSKESLIRKHEFLNVKCFGPEVNEKAVFMSTDAKYPRSCATWSSTTELQALSSTIRKPCTTRSAK